MVDKKNIDALIPKAVEAIEKYISNDSEVSSVYRNYLASFGTVARFSGIKTAVTVYSKDAKSGEEANKKSKEDKSKVINMVYYLLEEEVKPFNKKSNGEKNQEKNQLGEALLKYIGEDEKYAKDRIIEAAIAIKTALNLFKQVDTADEQGANNGN